MLRLGAYAALRLVLLVLLLLGLRLGGGDRDRCGLWRVDARHPVAARLGTEEPALVGRPPGQRLAARRVPVVVVAEVEEVALEVAVAARGAAVEAHRVLEGVGAVAGRAPVRGRPGLPRAERVPDLVAHGIAVAEAVAVAEDHRDRAAHVVAVVRRAARVLVERRLPARGGRRRPVEPDDVVG